MPQPLNYRPPRTVRGMESRVLPRRKEFVVQDLQEEIRQLKLRIDLLTKERDQLRALAERLKKNGSAAAAEVLGGPIESDR